MWRRRWRRLVADPTTFPEELPARLGLYKIFVKLWSSANDKAGPRAERSTLSDATSRHRRH